MHDSPLRRGLRRSLISICATVALTLGGFAALPGTSQAATTAPCDIYASNGTPCVAAHSTTRALFSGYNGSLYEVRRTTDGATANIGVLAPGGYANAATQDVFCANADCIITIIYDQTSRHNDLSIEGPGGNGGQNAGSLASALPVTAGGHRVYGLFISSHNGYRRNNTSGIATGAQAEGMYMVASGTHVNAGCCFDYGNAETSGRDTGNGHMDAVNLGTECYFPPCTGGGPWVEADLENGLFSGGNGSWTPNQGNSSNFVTAMLKNSGTSTYALKGGNSNSGGLSTWYSGALPNRGGYNPMTLEGAIVLGTGGDDTNASIGSFFEGVMTSGYPSDAAENAVQANIASVGYGGPSGGAGAPAGQIIGPGGQCVDIAGLDDSHEGAAVDLYHCGPPDLDQHWTHNSDLSLSALGRCLDIVGNGTANGTKVESYDCNGVGGQKWIQQSDGSLLNPQSGRCLDSPNGATADNTLLQIYDCNGAAAQKFSVNGGGMIGAPGGQCVDVAGDDNGGNGTGVQLWNCIASATDQHWFHSGDGRLHTLGRCLDIIGNGTANFTQVELYDCKTAAGQVWQQQADGSLKNPQSGRCLDDPNGNTASGIRLQIYDCNGAGAQKFRLS